MLRVGLVRVTDHAEQAHVLRLAVNRESGIEDFVAAVLAVGLRKHHQLHVGRVALQLGESLHQVVDFIQGQRQAKLTVGSHQRRLATFQNIHMHHRRGGQFSEQTIG